MPPPARSMLLAFTLKVSETWLLDFISADSITHEWCGNHVRPNSKICEQRAVDDPLFAETKEVSRQFHEYFALIVQQHARALHWIKTEDEWTQLLRACVREQEIAVTASVLFCEDGGAEFLQEQQSKSPLISGLLASVSVDLIGENQVR